MNRPDTAKPNYGNWVPTNIIYTSILLGTVFLIFTFFLLVLIVPAVFFLLVAAYFAYARYLFSPRGGNFQERMWDSLLQYLDWNGEGRALDIGCGNGALTIKLAKKYPEAQATGIDYWGKNWEYSKTLCERNANIENVGKLLTFQKASASALPFSDGYFDAVVSNLVFHEVKNVKDKRELIREALRVVKKGGKFAFQDLFLLKRLYGNKDDLIKTIKGWGVSKVEFIETSKVTSIPKALRLPFMVGTASIIRGEK